MFSIYILDRISLFSFVWLGLTKVFQSTAGRNLWIDPSKYPRKYSNYHVRQWATVYFNFGIFCFDQLKFHSLPRTGMKSTQGPSNNSEVPYFLPTVKIYGLGQGKGLCHKVNKFTLNSGFTSSIQKWSAEFFTGRDLT